MRRGLVTLCALVACAVPATARADSIYISQYGTLYFSGTEDVNRVTWASRLDNTVLIADPGHRIRSTDVEGSDPCEHPAGWLVQCSDPSASVDLRGGNDVFDAPRNGAGVGYYCCEHALSVSGGNGDDTITGGYVSDFGASGWNGDDTLIVGPHGSAYGGAGDDHIDVANGSAKGTVSCGPGNDVVIADKADRVPADCERVVRAP
jgi:hypothetical protein